MNIDDFPFDPQGFMSELRRMLEYKSSADYIIRTKTPTQIQSDDSLMERLEQCKQVLEYYLNRPWVQTSLNENQSAGFNQTLQNIGQIL